MSSPTRQTYSFQLASVDGKCRGASKSISRRRAEPAGHPHAEMPSPSGADLAVCLSRSDKFTSA
jgi:hypothetical protein